MKAKRKLGMGMKKTVALRSGVVNKARDALKKFNRKINQRGLTKEGAKIAIAAARAAVKESGGRKRVRKPRVLPIPKEGGILPLIPLFAGLSALGSIAGGTSAVVKAVNSAKEARKKLEESQRHNKTMEAIALGKKGSGLYLKQYRKGLGLYLKQQPKNY